MRFVPLLTPAACAASMATAAWAIDPLPPDTTYRPLPTRPFSEVKRMDEAAKAGVMRASASQLVPPDSFTRTPACTGFEPPDITTPGIGRFDKSYRCASVAACRCMTPALAASSMRLTSENGRAGKGR